MRLGVRTFLWSVVPLSALLLMTFYGMEHVIGSVIGHGVRSTLREQQVLFTRLQSQNVEQNRRYLRILGENATLKAGLQLVEANDGTSARLTVQDQLAELCGTAGLDLLLLSSSRGEAIAGVLHKDGAVVPFDVTRNKVPTSGFFSRGSETWLITSLPLTQGDETVGFISVGQKPDFAAFDIPLVLTHGGKVIQSSAAGVDKTTLEHALKSCNGKPECEVSIAGESFLTLASATDHDPQGYEVRTIANLDAIQHPVQSTIQLVFVGLGAAGILGAALTTVASTRSVVSPVSGIAQHLRRTASSGKLLPIESSYSQIREIREMIEGFNRAAVAIQEGEDTLHRAYVEFVGALASALDARDQYTAGHSSRVAELSCRVAKSLNLSPEEISHIRIGALLHDVGKIGVPDEILRKPAKLTEAESAIIAQHPVIGRRILEGVNGFGPFLDIVELHHENWDGTGYPHGLSGEEVPLAVRIVHVADAYDAMTSDRPYRRGLSQNTAVGILKENAGTQFDPRIVEAMHQALNDPAASPSQTTAELLALSAAVSTRSSLRVRGTLV